MERWPRQRGFQWLVAAAWRVTHPDVRTIEELAMPFVDVLASCDALVTKPGYGSFTEAACNGIPVLYVPRRDWPEEPCLVSWLEGRGRCRATSREKLESGDFLDDLDELLANGPAAPVQASGAEEAAAYLAPYLRGVSGAARAGHEVVVTEEPRPVAQVSAVTHAAVLRPLRRLG
jgi:hypothetical protein